MEMLTTDPHAPTAVRDPQRALDDHLADCLVALELDEVRAAGSIADIGAGAGLPGLPLAIAMPSTGVTLVESNGRKCEFIGRAIDACGLANARVACVRAEDWPEGRDRFDLVTARAVASVPVVAEYAAPLLRLGGALLAWRGRRDREEEIAAERAAAELGLEPREPVGSSPIPARSTATSSCWSRPALRPRASPGGRAWPESAPSGVDRSEHRDERSKNHPPSDRSRR